MRWGTWVIVGIGFGWWSIFWSIQEGQSIHLNGVCMNDKRCLGWYNCDIVTLNRSIFNLIWGWHSWHIMLGLNCLKWLLCRVTSVILNRATSRRDIDKQRRQPYPFPCLWFTLFDKNKQPDNTPDNNQKNHNHNYDNNHNVSSTGCRNLIRTNHIGTCRINDYRKIVDVKMIWVASWSTSKQYSEGGGINLWNGEVTAI